MHISALQETADREGDLSDVIDVCVHSNVYLSASRDGDLADTFFIKVLKAICRKFNIELDMEYKMPKIARNYKGQEVNIVRIEAHPPVAKVTLATASSKMSEISTMQLLMNTHDLPAIGGTTSNDSNGDSGKRISLDNPGSRQESSEAAARSSSEERFETQKQQEHLKPHARSASVTNISNPLGLGALASSGRSASTAAVAAPPSYFAINQELNVKWARVLPRGTNIVHTSTILKRNKFGIAVKRQLILTDEPSLFYVDISAMSIKGDVDWNRSKPPQVKVVDKTIFEVTVPGRVFRFEDQEKNAAVWVQKISSVAQNSTRL